MADFCRSCLAPLSFSQVMWNDLFCLISLISNRNQTPLQPNFLRLISIISVMNHTIIIFITVTLHIITQTDGGSMGVGVDGESESRVQVFMYNYNDYHYYYDDYAAPFAITNSDHYFIGGVGFWNGEALLLNPRWNYRLANHHNLSFHFHFTSLSFLHEWRERIEAGMMLMEAWKRCVGTFEQYP